MLIPVFLLLLANAANAKVLQTFGRWIVETVENPDPNERPKRFKLRCVNWVGHLETNVPEGLQNHTVADIANFVATSNFNCVRLTFSIDMALNPDQPVSDAFVAAAEPAGVLPEQMTAVYNQALVKNEWLASTTTRGAFARVIQELQNVNVTVILANTVSRASWCCTTEDGNGWWASPDNNESANSRFFDPTNWVNGLTQMASFATAHPNVVGMGLRGGLRAVGKQFDAGRDEWYRRMTEAATAVHAAHRNLLIVVGGVTAHGHDVHNYGGTDLSFIWDKQLDTTVFGNKLVYEFNHFEFTGGNAFNEGCPIRERAIGNEVGYLLTQDQPYTGPLFLSEFGWPQETPSKDDIDYYKCISSYMEGNDAEWAYWALQGLYYVRGKETNSPEPYGLLYNDARAWRSLEEHSAHVVLKRMFTERQGP